MAAPACSPASVGRRAVPLAGVLGLLLWYAPADASTPVRECQRPDGTTVFTDLGCADLGARRAPLVDSAGNLPRSGCARTVPELVREVSTAIELRDVNRLAGVYHWAGMNGRSGVAVMDRLQALVSRPLLDISPIRAPAVAGPWAMLDTTWTPPAPAPAPAMLQLEQLLPDGEGTTRTSFGLREHFGCVWIAGG